MFTDKQACGKNVLTIPVSVFLSNDYWANTRFAPTRSPFSRLLGEHKIRPYPFSVFPSPVSVLPSPFLRIAKPGVSFLRFRPVGAVPAAVGAAVAAPAKVCFSHHPVAFRTKIEVGACFQVVASVADVVIIGIPVTHDIFSAILHWSVNRGDIRFFYPLFRFKIYQIFIRRCSQNVADRAPSGHAWFSDSGYCICWVPSQAEGFWLLRARMPQVPPVSRDYW